MKLWEIPTGTDKGIGHHYLYAYQGLLGPTRTSVQAVVEVGVASGASLLLWREYFPRAHIHGIDRWVIENVSTEYLTKSLPR